MGMRSVFYRNLEPSAREHGISAINFAIVLLVLASFLTFSLETEPAISRDLRLTLSGFNILIVSVFAIEYVIRVWIAGENPEYRGWRGRLKYMFSPFALADLAK